MKISRRTDWFRVRGAKKFHGHKRATERRPDELLTCPKGAKQIIILRKPELTIKDNESVQVLGGMTPSGCLAAAGGDALAAADAAAAAEVELAAATAAMVERPGWWVSSADCRSQM